MRTVLAKSYESFGTEFRTLDRGKIFYTSGAWKVISYNQIIKNWHLSSMAKYTVSTFSSWKNPPARRRWYLPVRLLGTGYYMLIFRLCRRLPTMKKYNKIYILVEFRVSPIPRNLFRLLSPSIKKKKKKNIQFAHVFSILFVLFQR